MVVGTAGHIDHGKTSLVRALTGVDLDRLPEEQERGITIALGFTHLKLPGGRDVGFVDVPGHERLVRTMIAGATGLDAVLLCVSAAEGAMPQTREHLAILDLLGVRRGVVALTMADLVDAELLELAVEDVRDLVTGTFLDGAPVIPVSAVSGQGLEELRAALDTL
ncbi:MAG: 50S ribosome-binding GTPase, partial [Myxococcales bacterium]|nr:50S ribosome-binding GTPase [Myxococcales bacterium]